MEIRQQLTAKKHLVYKLLISILGFLWTPSNATVYQAIAVSPPLTSIPNDIPTSTIQLTITLNNQLSALSTGAFSNLNNLTHADLSSNNLSSIHPQAFQGTQLETLILYDNYFHHVPPIDHVASTLTYLSLRWNVIITVPTSSLQFYPNLRTLDISKNRIEWNTHDLDGLGDILSSLEKLDMSETNGPASGNDADLSSLAFNNSTELILSNLGTLGNVPHFNTAVVTHISKIDLTYNSITDSMISNSSNNNTIGALLLDHNLLTDLPDFPYSNWTGLLEILTLGHNHLTAVNISILSKMTALVRLNLESNTISIFPSNLSALSNLEEINLENNLITYVLSSSFTGIALSFHKLKLDGNPLVSFGDLSSITTALVNGLEIEVVGMNFVCNCSFRFLLEAYQHIHTNVTVILDSYPCESPTDLQTETIDNITLYEVCSGSTCEPFPTWYNIRTNTSLHLLGDEIVYYCRDNYEFTSDSAIQYQTSKCHFATGIWEPSFEQCTETISEEEEKLFTTAVDAPGGPFIGSITMICVCAEIAFVLLLDLSHIKHCLSNIHTCCKEHCHCNHSSQASNNKLGYEGVSNPSCESSM